jgi:acetyl esterase/lipase
MSASSSGVELRIPAGAGTFHPARWYPHPAKDAPLLLYLHGGAFVGAPTAGRPTPIEQLLMQAGASVVSLRYPLAPEHPFPQAIHAAYATLLYLSRERRRFFRAKGGILVAGVEAGGNIAAGVAMMVRDRKELRLAGQILFSPMLDPLLATQSLRRIKAGPRGCRFAQGWRQYTPRPGDACHPYANPADAVRLDGLPPTMLVTAGDDPFRDESLGYSQRLSDHGVDTHVVSLPPPTDLPSTCMNEAAAQAPWMAVARDPLRRFLAGAPHYLPRTSS